jgi:hypothetical protein
MAELNVKYYLHNAPRMAWLTNLISRVAAIFVVLLVGMGVVSAKDDCYYNPGAINYKYFLKHTGFTHAQWDDLNKEAIIKLEKENEEVFVGYSACETFGVVAQLRMAKSPEKLKVPFLIGKIRWLGGKVLSKADYGLLVAALKNKEFINDLGHILEKERVSIGVEGSDYQSFSVDVVHDEEEFFVEISWYM